jgi:hypothetical protein
MHDERDASVELTELLDEIGMEFALHTHHPLTHLEVSDASRSQRRSDVGAAGPDALQHRRRLILSARGPGPGPGLERLDEEETTWHPSKQKLSTSAVRRRGIARCWP